MRDPCICDQQIKSTSLIYEACDGLFYGGSVTDIAWQGNMFARQALRESVQVGRIAGQQTDSRPAIGQQFSQRESNPSRSTGDQNAGSLANLQVVSPR